MASPGTSAQKAEVPPPDDERKPESPPQLKPASWKLTARNATKEFAQDQCTDLAAALTYFSVLALFPGLLAVFSLLGLIGQAQQTVDTVLELVGGFAPADIVEQMRPVIVSLATSQASGLALILGLIGALWSASGYVGAFSRAMNRIYEIDEGRPIWKLRPQMLLLTAVLVILVALVLLGLVVSGPIAESATRLIGLGDVGRTVFAIVKWPLILIFVVAIVAMLYYFTPNVRQPKFRWISIGSIFAVLIWVVLSALFGLYIANFGNYNRTYGALAGVIVFLLWVWITNNALLFGAEIDSELERSRELQAGMKAEETLQLPPRDTRLSDKKAEKEKALIAEARRLRESAEQDEGADSEDNRQSRSRHRRKTADDDPADESKLSDYARRRESEAREDG